MAGVPHELRQIERLSHKRTFAGVSQQLPRQSRGLLAGGNDILQPASNRFARRLLQRQAGVADDSGQQVVEVVRDSACKNAEAFQSLRLLKALIEPFPFCYATPDNATPI